MKDSRNEFCLLCRIDEEVISEEFRLEVMSMKRCIVSLPPGGSFCPGTDGGTGPGYACKKIPQEIGQGTLRNLAIHQDIYRDFNSIALFA